MHSGRFGHLKEFFADCGDFEGIEHDYFESVEKGHGRIEERRCWAVEGEAHWVGIDKGWKGVHTMAMIERTRTIQGKSSVRRCLNAAGWDTSFLERVLVGSDRRQSS